MEASRGKANLLVALQFVALLLLVLNPFAVFQEVERIFSLTLYVIAMVILASAAVALGSALTASPIPKDDAELVTRGIYKWIRHPMYTALILIGLGLMLGTFNLFSLFVFTGLVVVLLYKSHYEDGLLADKHRSAAKYQSETGRFFPRF
jgi:protein-S-isoprenylcysteine O-methyltransferase Ste14